MLLESRTPSLSEIKEALIRVDGSGEITSLDAETLLAARGEQLDGLLNLATNLRDVGLERSGRKGVITYSKKVFLPITRLCQDRCHYCVFVETPRGLVEQGIPTYMSATEIVEIARQGAALGCKEALFTLGDRPENRWPSAREWLQKHGFNSTLDYVGAMARIVLEETGLLPHLNPGVMSWAEMQRLRPVAPSMGMMLETTATRLWSERGGVHYGSPDKDPALRLRVLDDAGRSKIPFTTGVLLGIGENSRERIEALFAIRESHERHGHIQETIVQNFRAKPRTAMQNDADLGTQEYVAAVAVTRLVMGPEAGVQAPPNLTDPNELALLLRAGISDWGGISPVTVDHVNPERPWPNIRDLEQLTSACGYQLRERLTAYPEFTKDASLWLDERLHQHVKVLTEHESGLAAEGARVVGSPWLRHSSNSQTSTAFHDSFSGLLGKAARNPSGLSDNEYALLLGLSGKELDTLCRVADEIRQENVGSNITYVANRNINSALYDPEQNVEATGEPGVAHILTPQILAELVDEAKFLGATEICLQGPLRSGLSGEAYLDLVRAIRSRQQDMHIHAFRPTEVTDGASRLHISVREFLQELKATGVDSVPGTGARILSDPVRAVLSKHSDPPVSEWVDVITTAHSIGLQSTSTMVYGHVETPFDQVAHLRQLCSIQDLTGGFSEFIAMPFVPYDTPIVPTKGYRPGPDLRETRAVHAVARLMLSGRINHIQAAWTKLGHQTSLLVLRGGADDFGGLLLDGTIWPEAGAEAYRELCPADIERLASEIGRPTRRRHTNYDDIQNFRVVAHPGRSAATANRVFPSEKLVGLERSHHEQR